MKIRDIIILGIFLVYGSVSAQQILTKEKAVELTLKNNYNIRITKTTVAKAKNNKSIYNNNFLPTVTGNAGSKYAKNNIDSEFQNGTVNSTIDAVSRSYNASIGLSYTLFNGFNRTYTFKKMKENYNLTELQARKVMENTVTTLFIAYYEVARLTENEVVQKESLGISKKRMKRAIYGFEYGQNTKLDVLNAEVDMNNDNLKYLDIKRLLANAKRDLNVVLGRNTNTSVVVDTKVSYAINLNLIDILDKAKKNNVDILQVKKNIELKQLDVKINTSNWMPNVSLTSSYAWNKSNNDAINQFSPIKNTQNGLNMGFNVSWSIFDGGKTKVNVANAKINLETQEIHKQQLEIELERNVNNTWETYQNAQFSLRAQENNVITNQRNFKRTNERYKLGQVNSIDFRQAQNNLINAELNLNKAKYTVKNVELQLLQLAGGLLNSQNF